MIAQTSSTRFVISPAEQLQRAAERRLRLYGPEPRVARIYPPAEQRPPVPDVHVPAPQPVPVAAPKPAPEPPVRPALPFAGQESRKRPSRARPPIFKATLHAVAAEYGVLVSEIMGPTRGRSRVVEARCDLCCRMREAGFSLPEIGRLIRRDHTSVMYAIRRHRAQVAS